MQNVPAAASLEQQIDVAKTELEGAFVAAILRNYMEKHKKLNGSLEEVEASTTALQEKERKWLKKMTKPKVLDDGLYG